MAHPTAVILVVGLNRSLLEFAPRLSEFAKLGTVRTIQPVLPAVTCSVQSSMLTGLTPSQHGIVGNGWYNRDLAEVQFWKQSNHLVRGEKVWETARKRDPTVTCANLFWWYNMYSSAEISVTPRPIYKADGCKVPDIYTEPADFRTTLQDRLGQFPLFNFWGPASSVKSSQWIAQAAIITHQLHQPTLNLVYLPHLDYALQKLGPNHPQIRHEVQQVDAIAGDLINYYTTQGVRVMIVSEYGIEAVDEAIPINRLLREAGTLRVREEQGGELLDAGASDAFAVADHQVAHVSINDHSRSIEYFKSLCEDIPGVERALDRKQQASLGIDHERSGDLVLIAAPGKWFSYQYWLDDAHAPDFARTVDIHRKPGYDPLELFIDPAIRFPKLAVARRLVMRKLGFRTLLDVIPLDPQLVRGSHGRIDQAVMQGPILITSHEHCQAAESLSCTSLPKVILTHLGLGVEGADSS